MLILMAFQVSANDLHKATLHKVVDGDTIHIFIDGELHKIRLLDIDCYESSNNPRAKLQASYYHKSIGEVLRLGRESTTILSNLLAKHKDNIFVEFGEKDRFKRDLGYIYIGQDKSINVNQFMLNKGLCESYVSSKNMKGE